MPELSARGLLPARGADTPLMERPLRALATEAVHSAHLKISEGCDHGCAFCAIPLMRGRHRSVPIERLVREARELEAAYQYYKDGGEVIFLGLAYVDTEPNSLAYLKKFGITYPNGPDLATRVSQQYRVRGVPETFIIDQQGRLAYFKAGPFSSTQEIIDIVDGVLEQ